MYPFACVECCTDTLLWSEDKALFSFQIVSVALVISNESTNLFDLYLCSPFWLSIDRVLRPGDGKIHCGQRLQQSEKNREPICCRSPTVLGKNCQKKLGRIVQLIHMILRAFISKLVHRVRIHVSNLLLFFSQ